MNNKTFIIVTVILAAVTALIFMPQLLMRKQGGTEAQMSAFPLTIGTWKGEDIPLRELDYKILETKNLIMRSYKKSNGDAVYLYIIYSGDNRKALHPPEICYTGGGGNTVLKRTVISLTPTIKANLFAIDFKTYRDRVAYWFRCGTFNTPRYVEQQLKTMIGRTFGKQTSGAMIRVSSPEKEGDGAQALERIKEFTALIEPLLDTYVP